MMSFEEYLAEGIRSHSIAAGVAIIYDNKILVVHPTNASWHKGACSIPKGGMEENEDTMTAALRELKEETGITISKDQLDPEMYHVDYFSKKRQIERRLFYYVCKPAHLSEIGMDGLIVPKDQLQLEEVDWAGFVSPTKAYPLMTRAQLIILDRHLSLSEDK